MKRWLLMMALCASAGAAQAQSIEVDDRYTLTNGRLYWYDNNEWEGMNQLRYQYEVAFDESNNWAEIHPFHPSGDPGTVTLVTAKGEVYLALDLANEAVISTASFSPYCVWSRTGRTGYYYQFWNNNYYYLVGSSTGLRVVKVAQNAANDDNSLWYDWDYGAAIQEPYFDGTRNRYAYHWVMYDTTGASSFDAGTWRMSCNSYQRPEDAIYSSYSYTQPAEYNNMFKRWYCTRNVGGLNTPAGNGALYMPVTYKEHDITLSTIAPTLGFQDLAIYQNNSPVPANFSMRYGEYVDPVITVVEDNTGGVYVTPAYTEYSEEIHRYGINRQWGQRDDETFGSAGVPTVVNHYYYNNQHNTEPPSAVSSALLVASYDYSLSNSSRRFLNFVVADTNAGGVVEGVSPSTAVRLFCHEVPGNGAIATLTVTVHYTNGASQSRTVSIRMSQQVDHNPMPEPTNGPVIGGSVFGGGRMANVGGNTSITVHSADSIYALYGGNDIAGWVQGANGANITLGTEKTDKDHPVHIGYVYGGGCGFYTYRGINFGVDANNVPDIYPYDFGPTDLEKVSTSLLYQSYYFNGEVYPWNYQPKGQRWNSVTNAWEAYTPPDYPIIHPSDTAGLHWNWELDEGGDDQRVTLAKFSYDPLYSNPADVDNNETGNNGNGTIPYIKTAHITVGVPEAATTPLIAANGDSTKVHNDYIVIDSLFGGAENAFIGVESNETNPANGVTIDVNGGTLFALFGGNNYGGSVANTSTVFVNIHDTKLPPAGEAHDPGEQSFFSGYGRDYGIRYVFGGGNKVAGSHANVNITGGMIDTCYLGGNQATVNRPVGTVNCRGDHFLCTNSTYPSPEEFNGISPLAKYASDPAFFDTAYGPDFFETEIGRYNIRCLFGGNNAADMNTLSVIQLYSGGISCVYGGGNKGDMNATTTPSEFQNTVYGTLLTSAFASHPSIPSPTGVSSIVSALKDSKIVCDYVFGGCKQSNVKASCGVYATGGIFGYINGGNDVSGDVGSTYGDFSQGHNNGTYVFIDSNALVIGDVVGGSDGYYHCDDGTGHYDQSELVDSYSGENYDPYDLYNDPEHPLLLPTHNNTNVAMKGGLVMGQVVSGGVHANVGFGDRANKISIGGVEQPIGLISGVRHGSIHSDLIGGRILGNVFGGGYLSSIFGLAYLHVGGDIKIDGSLFAGNDLKGSIEYFGAYTHGPQTTAEFENYFASNGDSLNIYDGGSWNARYSTYLKLDGSPYINSVYGSGNGNYDYEQISTLVCDEGNSVPLQPSTYIDINTTGGFIDTVFGGGNGVGVRDAVKVLLNCTQNDTRTVGTIFGGNNSEDMITCVPHIELLKGRVKNVFGGGNSGRMRASIPLYDVCGNTVEGVSSYVRVENANAIVDDTIFGGCRMAGVTGMAYVDIRNGDVNYVYGGNDISDTIHGNTRIDVSGGSVKHIYGGSNGRYDYENVNNKWDAYVFGTDHADTVALATAGRPFVDSSTVNLYGGNINTSVYGGGSLGDCRATLVEVNDQVCTPASGPFTLNISGAIYGGGEGNWEDLNWTGSDGKRHGSVVSNTNGEGATHVNLRHATTLNSAMAYGGGRGGDVDNTNVTVYPTWNIPLNALFGGCWGSDVQGTASLHLQGSANPGEVTAHNVFGGNDFTGNVYRSLLTVESGTYGNIYGGGNGDYVKSVYTSGNYAGNFTSGKPRRIYVPNNEQAEINFLDGTVTENLYGGGKKGTTLRLKRDDNYRFVTLGGAYKEADTTEAHADVSRYSHVLLNIKGGTFEHNVYGGAAGEVDGPSLVYGLKEVNMEGGIIKESVYGGSENVDDGYPHECRSTTNTTLRPSSILNLTGGTVKNHVYGGGYLGDVYGSVYVHVGSDAMAKSPIWNKTIGGQTNAYSLFKPGADNGYVDALATNELMLNASIYGGANWGNNVGSADFSAQGFYGGESRVYVNGEGYNTYMDVEHEFMPLMNIGNSIIGSGTSASGGDVYSRVDVRNYGAIDPATCKPTRQLRAIQRADAVYLRNTAIDYTGSTDAISPYISEQYTINRVDTLNCRGYNIVDVDATMTNIANVNFYYETGTIPNEPPFSWTRAIEEDEWVLSSNASAPICSAEDPSCHACGDNITLCDQLGYLDRDGSAQMGAGRRYTAFVVNNGINVDFISESGEYATLNGFGYLMSQSGTNAIVTARSKYGNVHANDGGFMPICSDSAKAVTGVTNLYDVQWCDCSDPWTNPDCIDWDDFTAKYEYRYTNYGSAYRMWTVGHGLRRRYAVIQAHSNPDMLVDNDGKSLNKRVSVYDNTTGVDSIYNYAIARSTLILPPTLPGHYYRISRAGIDVTDENDEMRLVDESYLPASWDALSGQWKVNNSREHQSTDEAGSKYENNLTNHTLSGATNGIEYLQRSTSERQYFSLMMSSGSHFKRYKDGDVLPQGKHVGDLVPPDSYSGNTNWTGSTTLSGNPYTSEALDGFTTAPADGADNTMPELNLYMLYNNDFSHTMVGTVSFTLEEYVDVMKRNDQGRLVNSADVVIADANDQFYQGYSEADVVWIPHNLDAPIDVELTVSTILQDFNDLEYELLAMYNEDRSDVFSRRVLLPATLQRRELYLRGVSWYPTDITIGNGDTLRSASNPDYFYLTDNTNLIKDPTSPNAYFGLTMLPQDNVSNNMVSSVAWHTISITEPLDIYTTAVNALGLSGSTPKRVSSTNEGHYYQELPTTPPTHFIDSARIGSETGHGTLIGVLDGRGEAAIQVNFNFDGSRIYNSIPGKGYIGKVVLSLVSYTGGDYSHGNYFHVTLNVKTRAKGDTIYVANNAKSNHGTLTRGGITLRETESLTAIGAGKRPDKYINGLKAALDNVYQEGDVIAILDTVVVPENALELIKGREYMPIPIIRYTGFHEDAPGEACVYRGPMIVVSGDNTVFSARCVDFQGGMLNKIRPTSAETGSTAWANAGMHNQLYDLLNGGMSPLYADTTCAYAPIIVVKNNGTLNLQNSVTVEQNYNGYNGSDASLKGAISVTNGGSLNLTNNVTIRQNLSEALTGSLPWNIQPRNGAVYVDGGQVNLKASGSTSAVTIQENYLNLTDSPFWKNHLINDGGTNRLVHVDFNESEYNLTSTTHTKSNVLLARTPSTASGADPDMDDAQSDFITFNDAIPQGTRIGISKWFPDEAEQKRDTIRVAYQEAATYLTEAANNGNFTSDAGNFMFYNYGVNNQYIYMGRCATFRFQKKTEPDSYVVDGSDIATDDALVYSPLLTATCPTGGDSLMARVQGGFFPYTYRWEDISHGTVVSHTTEFFHNEIKKQIAQGNYKGLRNAVADTQYTAHIDIDPNLNQSTQEYHLTVNDVTGHCELTKNVNVLVVKDLTDIPVTPFVKTTLPSESYDAWKDVEHSAPNEVGNTARGTRTYKGVKITPMVWTPGAGNIAIVTPGDEPNIYFGSESILGLSFCEGDVIQLATVPNTGYKFVMWDFDPYYANPSVHVVPSHNDTVVAYFAPEIYWKDVITTEALAGAVYSNTNSYTGRPEVAGYTSTDGSHKAGYVTTYSGDVHIYDENGLAWLISVVNGLHGNQVRPLFFNHVYIHKKSDLSNYDMKQYLWTPMGTLQYGFRGMLTGVSSSETSTTPLTGDDRVVIENLVIEEPDMTQVGFFASLETAIVSGIQLQSIMARGGQYVGGFAAKSTNSKFDNCAVKDDNGATTSILTTHYVSGGFIGKSERDTVVNSVIKAKFVGSAVYSGGAVGYGTATSIANTPVVNINRMNGLYLGGVAGYLNGVAPTNRLFRGKTPGISSHLANNYVRVVNDGHPRQLGGLVGYAENTILENNYVYGDMSDADASGGVASQLGTNALASHNYYAAKDVSRAVVSATGGAQLTDTASFHGRGNQVALSQPVYGINNLTRALNIWVREQNAAGHHYKTWRSDFTDGNNGYPVYGQPDLIPVRDTVVVNGCGEAEWDGQSYYSDTELQSWVIDSALMVDSMLTVDIRIHYSTRTAVEDSVYFGQNYSGYGFILTAAEIKLLNTTLDSTGRAAIVLTDTLHTAFGCDSIVSLTLNFITVSSDTSSHGEEEVQPVAEIKVYPNPTTSFVNVESDDLSHVEIYDGEGRNLGNYESHGTRKVTLDVSTYATGIYFIRVHNKQGVTIQKIIKQ